MHRFHSALAILAFAAVMTAASALARAQTTLTVLLDWFVNPDHAALIVASEKGFFEKQGLEVEMIEPADPNDPPKLVAAGKADLAITYQPQLHIQAAAGLPLMRIATLVATPLNTLMVLEDGPVKKIADLKGRTVGYSVGGFEEAILGTMLASQGLSLADIELVNVNFALSPALLSGRVDAVIGAYRNFELNQLAIKGSAGRAFYPEENGVPAYDELIVVAHRDGLDDPRLRAFLRALEQATVYLINHPQESWALFAGYKGGLDDELNRRAWADTLPRLALRPRALDRARYEEFSRYMLESGVVERQPPLADYALELR